LSTRVWSRKFLGILIDLKLSFFINCSGFASFEPF